MPTRKIWYAEELRAEVVAGHTVDADDTRSPEALKEAITTLTLMIDIALTNHVVFDTDACHTMINTAERIDATTEVLFTVPTFVEFDGIAIGGDNMAVRGIMYYPPSPDNPPFVVLYTADYRQKQLDRVPSSSGRWYWQFHQGPCPTTTCLRPSDDDGTVIRENNYYGDCVCYNALTHWLLITAAASILFTAEGVEKTIIERVADDRPSNKKAMPRHQPDVRTVRISLSTQIRYIAKASHDTSHDADVSELPEETKVPRPFRTHCRHLVPGPNKPWLTDKWIIVQCQQEKTRATRFLIVK